MIYRIVAVVLMMIFYGTYFLKMIYQKKQGIVTDQMGKGRTRDKGYWIEIALKTVTILVPLAELASIAYGHSMLGIMGKIFGIYLALLGDIVFVTAVMTMKDSWRAGIARDDKRGLVTEGIYRYSRNPAFLAFDLLDLGILLRRGLHHGEFLHILTCVLGGKCRIIPGFHTQSAGLADG